MQYPKTEEELINTMFEDFPGTRVLVRQIIDDIYECIDIMQCDIIYLTQEQLEALEEDTIKEKLIQEEINYENL